MPDGVRGAALAESTDGKFQNLRLASPYLGPSFQDEEVLAAIHEAGLPHRRSTDIAQETATLLAAGNIVGWFQGAMEFGPRALGNRSLLADPRLADIRETMNQKVKHRENFRPFSPSVLDEHVEAWFETSGQPAAADYMLMVYPARPEKKEAIPAVLHVDTTGRVQRVKREANELYYELIEAFEKKTGIPMVLNTSFNDSEPIVCKPEDAIATFFKYHVLVMNSFSLKERIWYETGIGIFCDAHDWRIDCAAT